MKVKIVRSGRERSVEKTVSEIQSEMLDCLKRNVIECCIRTLDEADAIAYALRADKAVVLDIIVRTLANYKEARKEDG